jgi:hypothetical protein
MSRLWIANAGLDPERLRGSEMAASEHEQLKQIVRRLPENYAPYGNMAVAQRDPWVDCSRGCRWYRKLAGPLGVDWGVCTNPWSHRCGLLTFEHQGCLHFEAV